MSERSQALAFTDRLTLIITTSPVPSAPSTELLTAVLGSFSEHCPSLLQCRVIVVFDTYDRVTDKARLKKGCVTPEGAKSYEAYKQNVKSLIFQTYQKDEEAPLIHSSGIAEYGSPFEPTNSPTLSISHTPDYFITFIEPTSRIGFSLAVRSALRLTTTPYVWVHQHDWILIHPIPINSILDLMQSQASNTPPQIPIHYICLPSIALLRYAIQSDTTRFPSLHHLTQTLRQDFTVHTSTSTVNTSPLSTTPTPTTTIPLTPLFTWHDKPHICQTQHYLSRIFPSRVATKRGAFIEDTLGQKARDQLKAAPLSLLPPEISSVKIEIDAIAAAEIDTNSPTKVHADLGTEADAAIPSEPYQSSGSTYASPAHAAFAKWATWLYYPGDGGQLCLKHLDGRVWRGVDGEESAAREWRAVNRGEGGTSKG